MNERMDKPLTKRKIQALNTKNKIFNTAMELIKKDGYDNISISQICKEAKISIGAFYHHFKSKECIIIEYFKNVDDYYAQNFNNLIATNSFDKIVEILSTSKKYQEEIDINTVCKIYQIIIYSGAEYFISKERPLFKILKDIIIEGQKKKEICNDIAPEEITEYILMFSRGIIYDWCLHHGRYDLDEKMNRALSIFSKSFKAKVG